MTEPVNTLQFRGIRDRTLEDQIRATQEGYTSVEQLAIDELATRLIALEQRVAILDGGEIAKVEDES